MSLLFNMLSRLVIAFLPRSKRLLISCLQNKRTVGRHGGFCLVLGQLNVGRNGQGYSLLRGEDSVFRAREPPAHTRSQNPNSWSLLKLMSIESVMPSNHLILCRAFSSCLQSFPASGSFQMSQPFASGGQSIGVTASTSVLPMNIQD